MKTAVQKITFQNSGVERLILSNNLHPWVESDRNEDEGREMNSMLPSAIVCLIHSFTLPE